jgi:hypothetical protein
MPFTEASFYYIHGSLLSIVRTKICSSYFTKQGYNFIKPIHKVSLIKYVR